MPRLTPPRRPARWALRLMLTTALLAGLPGGAAAQASKSTDQVVEGAKKIGKGVEETAKGIGKTVAEGAKEVGQRATAAGKEAKPAVDKMHDSAKGFGESLWDGMKAAGRSIQRFFTGESPPPARAPSHVAAPLEGPREGDLVRVFKVAADRQPACDARDVQAERSQQLREIERGRVALDVRVRRQDDLADIVASSRARSSRTLISSGPMPSSGESAPRSTW